MSNEMRNDQSREQWFRDRIKELEDKLTAAEKELKVTAGMLDSMSEQACQTGIKLTAAENALTNIVNYPGIREKIGNNLYDAAIAAAKGK